jgi:nucleoid-associated protein YgaU
MTMGVFDFVKSAGAKLFGRGDEPEVAPADSGPSFADVRAAALRKAVEQYGFDVKGLDIVVDGDKVTVTGLAATQEVREKVVLVVGNTSGIAQVDDQLDVSAPPARFHTVASGDTLSKIALEMYGDAMKYPVIFEANKPMLTHPDKIYPGQVLRIPALDT